MYSKHEIEESEFVEMSVTRARNLFDGDELPDDLVLAIDNAQAKVFNGDEKAALVVIRIVPDQGEGA